MTNLLASLKISTKILLLILMLGAVTVTVALTSSHALNVANDANALMTKEGRAPLYLARTHRRATEMVYAGYRAMAYDGASKTGRDAVAAEQKEYETAKSLLADALGANPRLKDNVEAFGRHIESLHVLTSYAAELGRSNKDDEARAVLAKADSALAILGKEILSFNDATIKADKQNADALNATAAATSFSMLMFSIAGVIMSIGAGLLVSRFGITGPLGRLRTAMQTLAAGDNTAVIDGSERGDEVGDMAKVVLVFRDTAIAKAAADAEKVAADATVQMVVSTLGASLGELSNRDLSTRVSADFPGAYAGLKDNYNGAIDNVRSTIEQVNESALAIRTGADEIAQASEDLARRTESNAASLEETSAALAQMEGRIKATATASVSTVARADQAIATVGGGRATADEAVQAMGRVSESAKGIDDVIEGLDKIAFQTRVLAMNAAVEAGRAGDAGRGFAVVADLVSALAMRAEDEAKRARDQLSITQSEIITAVEAVGKVDGALAAISSDVGEVNKLLASMASDNQVQSSAISEITAAVSSMDHATQQNAAMVEQTSAAARNLTQEVGTLAATAAQFNIVSQGVRQSLPVGSPNTAIRPANAPAVRRLKPTAAGKATPATDDAEAEWANF